MIFCSGLTFSVQGLTSFSTLKTETHYHQRIKEGFCFAIKSVSAFFLKRKTIGSSLATSLSVLVCVPFSHFAFMDSTPPTSKRIKTRVVRSGRRLEGWFSGDNELIEMYCFETSRKVINNPKVVSFDWLKSQKLDNVRRLLKEQLLKRLLEMKGNIYPDLIRVFYTNLNF